jgi:hypothetical protein
MRIAAKLTEARRNVLSGTAFTAQLSLLIGAVTAGLLVADFSTIAALEASAEAFRASGATVQTLSAAGSVSGEACDALESNDIRSGAIRTSKHRLEPAALPGGPVPTFEVTPGFADVMLKRQVSLDAGVLVSRSLAQSFDLSAGDILKTSQGRVRVSAVFDYPDDGRRPWLGYSVLVPTIASAAFDECWAEVWPQSAQLAGVLRTTVIPGGSANDQMPVIGQLNSTLGSGYSGATAFAERPTRFAPLTAGAIAFLAVVGAIRLRRVELASALHVGVIPNDLWSILLFESAVWTGATCVAIAPVVAYFTAAAPSADHPVFLAGGLMMAAGAIVGGLTGLATGTVLVRERRLFALFKERR